MVQLRARGGRWYAAFFPFVSFTFFRLSSSTRPCRLSRETGGSSGGGRRRWWRGVFSADLREFVEVELGRDEEEEDGDPVQGLVVGG